MKIIPPGISFREAVRAGFTGRIECRPYLDWVKTLPCYTCGKPPGDDYCPIDPSHVNSFKGAGTKSPDLWAIPECRTCHETYERGPPFPETRLEAAAIYMLQAFYMGHLKFVAKP